METDSYIQPETISGMDFNGWQTSGITVLTKLFTMPFSACDVPDEKSVDKFIFLAYHITVIYNSVTRKDRQWVKLNRRH